MRPTVDQAVRDPVVTYSRVPVGQPRAAVPGQSRAAPTPRPSRLPVLLVGAVIVVIGGMAVVPNFYGPTQLASADAVTASTVQIPLAIYEPAAIPSRGEPLTQDQALSATRAVPDVTTATGQAPPLAISGAAEIASPPAGLTQSDVASATPATVPDVGVTEKTLAAAGAQVPNPPVPHARPAEPVARSAGAGPTHAATGKSADDAALLGIITWLAQKP